MNARFQHCLKVVLGHEGGVSDHRADRGGLTNYGVTQKTFDDYNKLLGKPKRPVTDITLAEVEAIYSGYWKDAKCALMPEPLDLLLFDAAINHGAKRASKLLQQALGVDADGVIGKNTLSALHEEVLATGVPAVCKMYLDERAGFFDLIIKSDPTQAVFAKGWLNRVDKLRRLA